VFESEHKLKHLAFFDEIAAREEGDPAWREAVAGLVVLRLVDTWLDEGPSVAVDDAFAIRSIEATIEEIQHGTPIRTLLGRVLAALCERKPDIHVVVTPLMAYAQQLEYEAKWTLAADVYHSVLAHLHPLADTDASIAAHLRLGSCYRSLHRIEDATAAYASASEIATAAGDMVGILHARIGEGVIAVLAGNLPKAQTILEETIARADGDSLRDVRSRALHERATVANRRGQYELAIRYAYEALRESQSTSEKDRILIDIAGDFADLGVYTAAQDAYLVLSVTAQEQFTRWAALLNLIDVAARTGAQLLFEQHRRALVREALPPYLATGLELVLGTGYQRFGDDEKAREHLQRAMTLATEHGLNAFLFDAEEALLGLRSPAAANEAPAELALDVQEVAEAIRQMRETVAI
jgi:tetratricopeptide (TPR) repeat protein